jgi:hypothetical protein
MAMDAKQRAFAALCRGPVAALEVTDEDKEGLDVPQRMSLVKKVMFLRAFAQRGIILDGCETAHVSRNLVYYWKEEDEWFDLLFQAATEEAADRLEREAYRRAYDGVDEPVIYQGLPTEVEDKDTGAKRFLTVKKYSDQLMMLLLKGNKQEKYRENVKSTVDLQGQAGVLIVPGSIDADAWSKAAAEQQAKFAGNTGEEKK